ncbi:MAG: tetratricopeptide repeat protein [Desulfobacteraceae bacterium]|nr:tetratricopeptide repeat protein [Desulfobacteraceae bacterium]
MKQPVIALLASLTLLSCTANSLQQKRIAEATMELGEAHLNKGNFTAALKELLDAEKVLPKDPFLHNDLGVAYMGKERFDLAERHFKKAVALKPDYIPAKNNLGTAYLKQKKYDKAIECYGEFSTDLLYSTPHFAFSNMGWAYLGKKEHALARKFFSKALNLKPNFINAVHGLATSHIQSGNPGKAEALIEKTLKKIPNAPVLHADLAKIYELRNQSDLARAAWKRVLLFAPETTPLALEAESKLNK